MAATGNDSRRADRRSEGLGSAATPSRAQRAIQIPASPKIASSIATIAPRFTAPMAIGVATTNRARPLTAARSISARSDSTELKPALTVADCSFLQVVEEEYSEVVAKPSRGYCFL